MTRRLLSFTFSRKDLEQLPRVNASSAHWTAVGHFDVVSNSPAHYGRFSDGTWWLYRVACSFPQPLEATNALADCVALYPLHLDCTVDSLPVRSQLGGFYGSWITVELTGPFKGEPGSEGW